MLFVICLIAGFLGGFAAAYLMFRNAVVLPW